MDIIYKLRYAKCMLAEGISLKCVMREDILAISNIFSTGEVLAREQL